MSILSKVFRNENAEKREETITKGPAKPSKSEISSKVPKVVSILYRLPDDVVLKIVDLLSQSQLYAFAVAPGPCQQHALARFVYIPLIIDDMQCSQYASIGWFHLTSKSFAQFIQMHPDARFKRLIIDSELLIVLLLKSSYPNIGFSNAEIIEIEHSDLILEFDKYDYNFNVNSTSFIWFNALLNIDFLPKSTVEISEFSHRFLWFDQFLSMTHVVSPTIPKGVKKLDYSRLVVTSDNLTILPENIELLTCNIICGQDSFSLANFRKLKTVSLCFNTLTSTENSKFPDDIEDIEVYGSALNNFYGFDKYEKLKKLKLHILPQAVETLFGKTTFPKTLTCLDIREKVLVDVTLTNEFEIPSNLTELRIIVNGRVESLEFPPNLEILELSLLEINCIIKLPERLSNLSLYRIGKDMLHEIGGCLSLKRLTLRDCDFDEASPSFPSSLIELHLTECRFECSTDKVRSILQPLQHLQTIKIKTEADFVHVVKFILDGTIFADSLKQLSIELRPHDIQAENVVLGKNCKLPAYLEELRISSMHMSLGSGLKLPKSLKILDLEYFREEFLLSSFVLSPELTKIRIMNCNIYLRGTQFPASLRTLYFHPMWLNMNREFNDKWKKQNIKEINATNLGSLEWFTLTVDFQYKFDKGKFHFIEYSVK
ncbi:uncharacterized protein RJT20DRAFT_152019 [Scheffersomyces xylosifermentans]|uniref:uncharacterized protein n=1 Tax=Scheffersomyces xylosifermentans TaxID=1304137 RepID=UPI00315D6D0F